jgi:L,D-peptidoglycan transpeptidase YkuD (ErfK/YbiS/YcfS/YnhG family)
MFRLSRLRSTLAVGAILASVLGGSLIQSAVQATPAQAAPIVYNACDRLNAGQVKYNHHNANRVTFANVTDRTQNRALVTTCVKSGTRYVQDWQAWGYTGRPGFKAPGVPSGHTQYEWSPTGSFSVTEGFGLRNPGTALPYRTLNPRSRWGGGGEYAGNYNKYFESTRHYFPDENMWEFAMNGDYTQGAVLNYNRPPDKAITYGDGFAIFLHSNPRPTAGCISLPEAWVTRFLQNARSGDRVIMGAVDDIFTPYKSNPNGAIHTKYHAMGGQVGTLKQPTWHELASPYQGGAYRNFNGGRIMWSAKTGAKAVTNGAIKTKWEYWGSEGGSMGYPTNEEVRGLVRGGAWQGFQNGAMMYSPATGAWPSMSGPIRTAWAAQGYERGRMGYPKSQISTVNGVQTQVYEGGKITWSSAAGAKYIYN